MQEQEIEKESSELVQVEDEQVEIEINEDLSLTELDETNPEFQLLLKQRAVPIRQKMLEADLHLRRGVVIAYEAGEMLLATAQMLLRTKKMTFGKWIDQEFPGENKARAYNYLSLAVVRNEYRDKYGFDVLQSADTTLWTLYALGRSNTPSVVRDRFAPVLIRGEEVTYDQVQNFKTSLKAMIHQGEIEAKRREELLAKHRANESEKYAQLSLDDDELDSTNSEKQSQLSSIFSLPTRDFEESSSSRNSLKNTPLQSTPLAKGAYLEEVEEDDDEDEEFDRLLAESEARLKREEEEEAAAAARIVEQGESESDTDQVTVDELDAIVVSNATVVTETSEDNQQNLTVASHEFVIEIPPHLSESEAIVQLQSLYIRVQQKNSELEEENNRLQVDNQNLRQKNAEVAASLADYAKIQQENKDLLWSIERLNNLLKEKDLFIKSLQKTEENDEDDLNWVEYPDKWLQYLKGSKTNWWQLIKLVEIINNPQVAIIKGGMPTDPNTGTTFKTETLRQALVEYLEANSNAIADFSNSVEVSVGF